jgi:hypothetical protein
MDLPHPGLGFGVAGSSFGIAFFTAPDSEVPRWVPLLAYVAGSVANALLLRVWRATADPGSG